MRKTGLRGVSPTVIAKRLAQEISAQDTFGNAAELAYFFLLALFPLLIFFASLLGYLPIPDLFERLLNSLARVMPPDAMKLVADTLLPIIINQHGGLLSFGILAAIWAASAGVSAIIVLLNQVYRVQESRPYWRVKLTSLAITIGLVLPALLASVLVFFGDHIFAWISSHFGFFGPYVTIAWQIIKWLVSLGALFIALELIYYFGPDVKQQWKWITPGSITAVLIWLLASAGLSFYVKHFAKYNATYGSLGGVIILMLWFYLSGFAILLGGQLNAIIEHASETGKAPGERYPNQKPVERRQGERRRQPGDFGHLRPV